MGAQLWTPNDDGNVVTPALLVDFAIGVDPTVMTFAILWRGVLQFNVQTDSKQQNITIAIKIEVIIDQAN